MADVRRVDGSPRQRAEERAPTRDAALLAQLEPPAYERDRAGVDAHDAPLAALASLNDERPRVGVLVLDRDRECLADPKPAPPADGERALDLHLPSGANLRR